MGKTKRGKGTKWMILVDGQGLPFGVRLESASPAEVKPAEATLLQVGVPRPRGRPRQKPKRVIADRDYDSEPLRERLRKRGIELIAPYRKNNGGNIPGLHIPGAAKRVPVIVARPRQGTSLHRREPQMICALGQQMSHVETAPRQRILTASYPLARPSTPGLDASQTSS